MECKTFKGVKIYNLTCGKSLPDWLSEKKRRMMQKKNVDIRRRIDLIQDFEMPTLSNRIKMSRDGNFIFTTGIYKPRVRCYDVNNLAMKFDRCFDSEAVEFEILSDDYKKLAILQCDRSIEIHAQHGSYYKFRIPRFGRDMKYHRFSCDLLTCGSGSDIYRMNLDQGTFLYPYHTNASSVNKLAIHEYANIIACGTIEGNVEVWDPRQKSRVAIFDIALSVPDYSVVEGFPSVTALSFKGDLTTMAVGTYTGQVMLYDIRATKPFLVKDHDASVQNIEFIENESLIASMDEKYVKFWKQNSGELYTAVSSPDKLNDICIVPNTGLFFLANEEKKILSYFIPSIGPAPKWCCFLDNITEELEESQQDTVYDDYKFVVKSELEQLQLSHLIGTTLLRPYMHGYFMDIRLYKKAIALVQPTAYQEVKKKLINNKVENERNIKQIQVKKLPTVNKEYAKKLLEKKTSDKQQVDTPFEDDRFKDLFENPDFEIKETDEEYARIKATVERNNKKKVTIVPESKLEHLYEDDHQAQSSSSSEEELEDDSDEDSEEDVKPSSKRQRRVLEAVDSDRFNLLKKDEENEELLIPIGERLKNSQTTFKESKSVGGDKIASWTIKRQKKE